MHVKPLVILIVAALVPAIAYGALTASVLSDTSSTQLLIIGGSEDYPPYSYIDDQGVPEGFATALTQEIARETGTNIRFNLSSWADARANLENKRVSVLQDAVYSEERDEIYDFSAPYYEGPYVLFVRSDSPDISSSELSTHQIITINGDIGHDYLISQGLGAQLIITDSYSEGLSMLSQGQGDCLLMEKLPGLYWIHRLGFTNIKAGPEVLFEVSYCYAVLEGDQGTLSRLNAGMTIAREDGSYDKIYDQWFGIIERENANEYKQALSYLAWGILALFVILVIMAAWSWSLKKQVKSRTLILYHQNEELLLKEQQLTDSGEELHRLNEELENRVMLRTAELQQANRELESFSYSISHDLRGPLRAIDGFSRILLEEYTDKLDSEGRRYLISVSKNAVKMGQLIDDLLTYTEISRLTVEKEDINMTQLARSAFNENLIYEPDRDIDFTAEELPACRGNEAMLRQLWLNLISNALKFTRKQARTVITVGSRQNEKGGTVYYISDNGEGFDMKYISKLFNVFNRLHHYEDYEGTGIGLAIVKRVVERHGGEVWAESQLNSGSTFSFSLNSVSLDKAGGLTTSSS